MFIVLVHLILFILLFLLVLFVFCFVVDLGPLFGGELVVGGGCSQCRSLIIIVVYNHSFHSLSTACHFPVVLSIYILIILVIINYSYYNILCL